MGRVLARRRFGNERSALERKRPRSFLNRRRRGSGSERMTGKKRVSRLPVGSSPRPDHHFFPKPPPPSPESPLLAKGPGVTHLTPELLYCGFVLLREGGARIDESPTLLLSSHSNSV